MQIAHEYEGKTRRANEWAVERRRRWVELGKRQSPHVKPKLCGVVDNSVTVRASFELNDSVVVPSSPEGPTTRSPPSSIRLVRRRRAQLPESTLTPRSTVRPHTARSRRSTPPKLSPPPLPSGPAHLPLLSAQRPSHSCTPSTCPTSDPSSPITTLASTAASPCSAPYEKSPSLSSGSSGSAVSCMKASRPERARRSLRRTSEWTSTCCDTRIKSLKCSRCREGRAGGDTAHLVDPVSGYTLRFTANFQWAASRSVGRRG